MLLLLLVSSYALHATNQLRIMNPKQSWWTWASGTIEDATFSLRPKGIYTEVSMYLTFNANETNFPNTDSLEVQLTFELPAQSVVIDSWLWIGDDIVQAEIWDRWKADSVYEGLVNRRVDPSILTQDMYGDYALKVFPIFKGSNRRVKITYLVPNYQSRDNFIAMLPMNVLTTSYPNLPLVKILYWPSIDWTNPSIINTGNPSYFTPMTHPTLGSYLYTEIQYAEFYKNPSLSVSKSISTAFLGKYTSGNENYYQLSISPSVLLDSIERNKVAVLVDFEGNNTDETKQSLLSQVKQVLLQELSPNDSFNLILSGLTPYQYSSVWIAANAANIDAAFLNANSHLSSYTNLATLISSGINFIKTTSPGKLFVISSSQQYGSKTNANALIFDLLNQMQTPIPVYIVDYQTLNFDYHLISNRYYYGNEYFYITLASMTGGAYHRRYSNYLTTNQVLKNCLNESFGVFSSFEITTDMDNGFCYSRYLLAESITPSFNSTLQQVGKFSGTFPFHISLTGEYKGNVYNKEIVIPAAQVLAGDSSLKQVWTGANMRDLYTYPQTNTLINQIINVSLENRALSYYTAFICLEEPEWICETCVDETGTTDIDSLTHDETYITAYPNPFEREITLKIAHPSTLSIDDVQMVVYDIRGAVVKTFTANEVIDNQNNEWEINWDSSDALSSGMYFFKVQSASFQKTTKLIKL